MKVTIEIPKALMDIVKSVVIERVDDDADVMAIEKAVVFCEDNPQEISCDAFGDNAANIGISIGLHVLANKLEQMGL